MISNTEILKARINRTKIVVFLTLLIYILNLFIPIYSIYGENINNSDINIYSRAAILVDSDTGDILYSKNADNKVYPASTTKILTAIIAIESLDLNSNIVASETAVTIPFGSSNVALKAGEIMTVKDLLYCLLLHSGNDSANVLAEAVSGTIPDFILLMNSKAKELGLTESNFTSAHGFHDKNHYTTPSDMMKILKYAIKNDTFKTIFGAKDYTVSATNKTPEVRKLQSTNRLILTKDDSYLSDYYQYCLGGKTGFTDEAGRTFVAYGKKANRNVILGTFDVMDVGREDGRYIDAISLFEYGFNNFTKTLALKKNDFKFEYIDQNSGYKYILGIKEDVYFSVKNTKNESIEEKNIKYSISTTSAIDETLLNKYIDNTTQNLDCQVVGDINITFNQNSQVLSKQVPLILLEKNKTGVFGSLPKANLPSFKKVLYVFLLTLLLMFLLVLLLIIKKNIRRNRRKNNIRKRESKRIDNCSEYVIPSYLARCSSKNIVSKKNKN